MENPGRVLKKTGYPDRVRKNRESRYEVTGNEALKNQPAQMEKTQVFNPGQVPGCHH